MRQTILPSFVLPVALVVPVAMKGILKCRVSLLAALTCLWVGVLNADCTRSVRIESDYEDTGSAFYCYRLGWFSPVTGNYFPGEFACEWEEYTVVVPPGRKAEVSVSYDRQISNTSGKMTVFGMDYTVGRTARRTLTTTTSFIVGPEQVVTDEVGGFTVRCYFTVTVRYYPIAPNLQVSVDCYPKGRVVVDEEVMVYLTVRNTGESAAAAFVAGIYDGGTKIKEVNVDSILPNSYRYLSLPLPKLAAGIHSLSAVADIRGAVAESDESDNSAEWTLETRGQTAYTVRYDANGGVGTIADQKMTYGVGAYLAKEGYERDGLRLAGWSTRPSGDVEFAVGDYVTAIPDADKGIVKLYAVWKPPFVIVFDANGGTGEMADQHLADGDEISPNRFEREGFEFCGWAVAHNGMPLYADGAAVYFHWFEDFHQELRDGMTLYACWGRRVETDICPGFRFLYGGASEDRSWMESVEGGETVLSSPWFGSGESGWLRVKFVGPGDLSFEVRRSGEKCYFATSPWECPILTAGNWIGEQNKFYDRDHCLSFFVTSSSRLSLRRMSWTPESSVSVGESVYQTSAAEWITAAAQSVAVKVSVPTLREWTAQTDDAWLHLTRTNGVCTEVVDVFAEENETGRLRWGEVTFSDGDSKATLTVYQWSYPTVRILLDKGDGSTPQAVSRIAGKPYGELDVPLRRGYVFLGWSAERDSDVFLSGTSLVPDVATTIYARWRPVSYTVVYDVRGGSEDVAPQEVRYDEVVELNGIRGTNGGLRFAGWATSEDGRVVFRDRQTVSNLADADRGTVKLYAVWRDEDGVAGEGGVSVFPVPPSFAGEAKYSAKGLPKGLKINARTGEISGTPEVPGRYSVVVTATSVTDRKLSETQAVEIFIGHYADETIPVAESYGPYVPGVMQVVTIAEASGCTVSGLPSGMKWTKNAVLNKDKSVQIPANSIYGTPGKPGAYVVYFTKTVNGTKRKASAMVVVGPLPTVSVTGYGPIMGSIAGTGGYQAGKKVTLKATAKKGYVFAGWYDGGHAGRVTLPGTEPLSQAASYAFTMPTNDVAYVAAFVTAAEDAASIGATVNGFAFGAGSGGEGAVVTQLATNVMAGVYLAWPVAASAISETTVKVAGLPSGLKFTAKPITSKVTSGTGSSRVTTVVTNVAANTIYGAPTAASKTAKDKTSGLMTVTPSKVKVTVTTSGKSKAEYVIDLTVDPLPAWAQGEFSGLASTAEGRRGSASMSVTAAGKVSGKVIVNGTNCTFSAASYDITSKTVGETNLVAVVTGKLGKEAVTGVLTVGHDGEGSVATQGTAFGSFAGADMTLCRNVWKDKGAGPVPVDAQGLYMVKLGAGDRGTGYLSLTVDKKGAVKVAGRAPDGTALSASATLNPSGTAVAPYFADLFCAPSAYKGGYVAGRVSWDADGRVSSDGLDWTSFNPESTTNYCAGGFDRVLDLAGVRYVKDDAPKNLGIADVRLETPAGATLSTFSFSQSTGIWKGALLWNFGDSSSKPVKIPVEGGMVQGENLEGFGTYEVPASYVPYDKNGNPQEAKAYKVKESVQVGFTESSLAPTAAVTASFTPSSPSTISSSTPDMLEVEVNR